MLIGLLEVAVGLMRAMPNNMSINKRSSTRRARHKESITPHAPPASQSLIQGGHAAWMIRSAPQTAMYYLGRKRTLPPGMPPSGLNVRFRRRFHTIDATHS